VADVGLAELVELLQVLTGEDGLLGGEAVNASLKRPALQVRRARD
jgi:hypothetical protein